MGEAARDSWSLAELSEQAGVPRRTIRYYIARGLLEGPVKAGPRSAYGPGHLERLQRIQALQGEGLTLAEIARVVAGPVAELLPEPVAWQSYRVAGDVTVYVRAGVTPWRMKAIREALRDLAARLAETGETEENDSGADGHRS